LPRSGKFALQLLVTAAALYLLFRVVPFHAVLQTLKTAHPGYVLAAVGLQALNRLPVAWRTRQVAHAQGVALTLRQIIAVLFSSSFYNLLLPGVIVGGAATWLKYVQFGTQAGPAFVIMVVSRLAEAMAIITSGACFWIIDHSVAPLSWLALPVAYVGLLFAFRLVFSHAHLPARLLGATARLMRSEAATMPGRLAALAGHFGRMRALRLSDTLLLLLACVAQDLITAGDMYLFAHGLDLPLDFTTVLWLRAAIYLAGILPLSLAGLGVREGVLVLLTAPYGIAAADAIAWSLLLFAGNVAGALLGGLMELRLLWSRRRVAP
jgi:uncharacterized membrane protein YbhN (UPF0104 family)